MHLSTLDARNFQAKSQSVFKSFFTLQQWTSLKHCLYEEGSFNSTICSAFSMCKHRLTWPVEKLRRMHH